MAKDVYKNAFAILKDKKTGADLQFRSDMLILLDQYFEKKNWSQKEIAKALKISQPRVSELLNGKINLFSSDKLIGFLGILEIRFRPYLDAQGSINVEVSEAN